ncbi:MAG: hypothetical protein ABI277_10720 [Burkholderiaceae bacterium]
MKFTPVEFVCFARSAQSRDWVTLNRHRPFKYEVEAHGLNLIIENGNRRLASNRDIVRFCEIHNAAVDPAGAEYGELFTKSYLRAIAARFDSASADVLHATDAGIDPLGEGAVTLNTSKGYERSSEARRQCIEIFGWDCSVRGMSFARTYGDFAAGFIHVHHLHPFAKRDGQTITCAGQ